VAELRTRTSADEGTVQVLALTKYGRSGASSRCRFLNYVPLLRTCDIAVTAIPLLSDSYVRQRLFGATVDYFDVARSYAKRLADIAGSSRFDVLWIEGELLPRWPATLERLLRILGRRFVVDLDDAIFHSYDHHPSPTVRKVLGRKIDLVFRRAETVVAGNEYLAERARKAGAHRVILVPTAVDYRAYAGHNAPRHDKLTFGWIGSSATAHYLQTIRAELDDLCNTLPASLRLIGLDRHSFVSSDVALREWREDTEIEELASCDIGLAPLSDGLWERGKCGLKAIQYMASGIPVLAANVGVLPSIVQHGKTGFVYSNGAEFAQYARQLAKDPELRRRMGAAGRERVAASYSIHGWVDTIAEVLTGASSKSRA
jgi:glycosyltransferase involved in cell wall biosynthesis